MKILTPIKTFFLLFSLFISTFASCRFSDKKGENMAVEANKNPADSQNEGDYSDNHRKKHKKHYKRDGNRGENPNYTSESGTDNTQTSINTGDVPTTALQVLKYVRQNGTAMDGYVGGRRFGNFENNLPKNDASGKKIDYQEWDVNPKTQGKNRGTERLITGSDGKAYYTNDHYRSFVEVKK